MSKRKANGFKGQGMEGFFAKYYDKNARNHIFEQYREWLEVLTPIFPKDAKLLEIAPGPGYLAIELGKLGIRNITGLDISRSFVEIAARNAREANVQIDFKLGNASAMPFDDGQFTHIVCTSAFKNFSEPVGALHEMYRVLAPGGIAWISDMRRDVSNDDIDDYVGNVMKLKGFGAFMTGVTFKHMLRKRAYSKEAMLALVSKTPFRVQSLEQKPMEFRLLLKK